MLEAARLNPQQEEAVRHGDGPLLIMAGPGSGKTRCITQRIAHVVSERGVWPSRILAITFTNKAAREMRERLAALLPQVKEALAGSPWAAHLYTALAELLDLMQDPAPFRNLPPAVGRVLVKMVEGFIWESAAVDEHLRYVVEMHWPQRAEKGPAARLDEGALRQRFRTPSAR